mmetsp:Transcript_22628/g.72815  ORF Transcript_22628/g.72815 Transcript_22628/m.72815 type:complete len:321 (-) Transcript_22628:102-1064(-)
MMALAFSFCLICTTAVALQSSPRLWVGDGMAAPSAVELTAAQVNYVSRVMRLKEGDEIRVFGAAMGEWSARLAYGGDRRSRTARALPVEERRAPLALGGDDSAAPRLEIEVWFAPLKKKRATLLVEKAVELGATTLRAVKTQYADVRAFNGASLFATAIEAAEQSERLDVPDVHEPAAIADLPGDNTVVLACVERTDDGHLLAQLLDPALGDRLRQSGRCAVLVGPEGGFSDADLDDLRRRNATFVSLGDPILRAETAAIAALTLVVAATTCTSHSYLPPSAASPVPSPSPSPSDMREEERRRHTTHTQEEERRQHTVDD